MKVTIDRATIELAIEAHTWALDYPSAGAARSRAIASINELRAALAEPAVEPFGYFRAEPFGWTDCAPTDEGAKALYEVAPPAEPVVKENLTTEYDQTALELCNVCGWKAVIPTEGCLNCEREKQLMKNPHAGR